MNLKEVFLAGKREHIAVPLHLRNANAANDPRLLEEARQYLVNELNKVYLKRMANRLLWVGVTIATLLFLLLALSFLRYWQDTHQTVTRPIVSFLANQ